MVMIGLIKLKEKKTFEDEWGFKNELAKQIKPIRDQSWVIIYFPVLWYYIDVSYAV